MVRPPGVFAESQALKLKARDKLRKQVLEKMPDLVSAQIENALGLKFLVVRSKKSGKFERVVETPEKLNTEEEIIEVWAKDPSIQAFTDLMNRAIDKPAEQEPTVPFPVNLVVRWADE